MKNNFKIQVNKRIIEVYNYLELNKIIKNKSDFADKIGILPQTLNNIFNGKQYFTVSHISKLLIEFSFINSEWLLTGEGEMLKSEGVSENNSGLKDLSKQLQLQEKTISTLEKSVSLLENQLKNCEKDKEKIFIMLNNALKNQTDKSL